MGIAESTRFAVLGLATEGPTYAYAIAEELRRWPLDEASAPTRRAVYHAVDWLVDEQLVVPRDATVEDLRLIASGSAAAAATLRSAPIRKLVEATPAGHGRFLEWLGSPLTSEDEIFWRLGSARQQDMELLIRVFAEAERAWFARVQEQMTPNVGAFAARGASWKATRAALLSAAKSKQLDGQAVAIRELSALLSDLQRENIEGR